MDVQAFVTFDPSERRLVCQGQWDLVHFNSIKNNLKMIKIPKDGALTVDGADVTKMDSSGAWLLNSTLHTLKERGIAVQLQRFSEQCQQLLDIIAKRARPYSDIPKIKIPNFLARLGKMSIEVFEEFSQYLNFVGVLTIDFLRNCWRPARWRWNEIAAVIYATGYRALIIIGLLSFMIGVVISYQMGNQLRNYGANVFIVDLLGLSVLREFGPLITAIMIAGRTGSSFTAQLGIMKINQEIDALNIMGITPAELLLTPRVIGLIIVLPLLTMWADIFGVLGGALMANNMLGITFNEFLQRFQHEIPVRSLIIGLGKAPVFAMLIASIGCFQGMQVEGSASSVGRLTTRSVVLAIFFIIVTDAIFSVVFSKFKL
jgi:phospholipid/cholesterol/gamma-HCH transport system permease protein